MEAYRNTNRMLATLERNLTSPEYTLKLRASQHARSRVRVNLDDARDRLSNLEKQSGSIRTPGQRQQLDKDLQKSTETLQRLDLRLRELNDTAIEEEEEAGEEGDVVDNAESTGEDDGENEDRAMRNTFAPARKDVYDGLDTGESQPLFTKMNEGTLQASKGELRARKPLQASDNRSQAATTAREELFKGRPQTNVNDPNLSRTEALMSHNRTEQEALTSGLLALARSLKESSLGFASSLEADKEVVKRAEGGLDQSAKGMDAAEKKMSTLRRMSEGQGWWGRIKLYGIVFGLWVACFLIVFVGPKLRF